MFTIIQNYSNKTSVIDDLSKNVIFKKNKNIINIKNLKIGYYIMQLDFPYRNNTTEIIVGSKVKIQHVTKLIIGPDNKLYYKSNNKEESEALQMTTAIENNQLKINLSGHDPSTLRAHVILSNFYPDSSYYNKVNLKTNYPTYEKEFLDPKYLYNNSIEMTKEEMYIKSRKLNQNLVGNMLRKPTTILVPLESKKATGEKKDIFGDDVKRKNLDLDDISLEHGFQNQFSCCSKCEATGCGLRRFDYGSFSFNYSK